MKVDPKDQEIKDLNARLDREKWVNRQQRQDTFWRSYPPPPTYIPVHYADPYHDMLSFWLMKQSIDNMAMFMYCHQSSMASARAEAIYAQNADLRARVAALEASKTPINRMWTPTGVDTDAIYDDGFVNAAYNPTPRTSPAPPPAPRVQREPADYSGFWHVIWVIVKVIFCLVVLVVLIRVAVYYGFEKRYNWPRKK